MSGGGPTHNAIFLTDDVDLTGPLATNAYVAASGSTLTQSRCEACGTPVMGQTSARPHFRTIRLGFLEPDHGLEPQAAIWTQDAPDWAQIDPVLEVFTAQPPPPAHPSAT